jgi:hypothetical protein
MQPQFYTGATLAWARFQQFLHDTHVAVNEECSFRSTAVECFGDFRFMCIWSVVESQRELLGLLASLC